jgi:DNA-binding NtrC family response regulator
MRGALPHADRARRARRARARGPADDLASFDEARASFERDYLSQLLRITDGNVSQAARSRSATAAISTRC